MSVDTLTFTAVDAAQALDPTLRAQLLATWVRVTDAGGAVGFVPPADAELIAATLDGHLASIAAGRDALGVLRRGGGSDRTGGPAVGMGILAAAGSPRFAHWRTVSRVMVDPDLQGRGAGRTLMDGLHGIARDLELEFLCLAVRGGVGLEGFYGHLGYTIFGRNPRAIRVAPGDDRDEVHMRCEL